MNRQCALATLNRKILEAYSQRTIRALRATVSLRVALPHLEPSLARNVAKETKKDALVIHHASIMLAAGVQSDRDAINGLLDATKEIDRAFLAQITGLPIRIVIPYREIVPIRLQRIERLLAAASRILDAWQKEHGLRAALQASYSPAELERLFLDLLRLYAIETRVLSRSVQLPLLLVPLREHIAQNLNDVMNEVARRLAAEMIRAVFKKSPRRCGAHAGFYPVSVDGLIRRCSR